MKTDNEIIAEFMGWERWRFDWLPNKLHRGAGDKVEGVAIHQLKYDTSWDWLMPVVEKIQKLYSEAFPSNEKFIELILAKQDPIDSEYIEVIALPLGVSIQEAHAAIVKFIKWYNESKGVTN